MRRTFQPQSTYKRLKQEILYEWTKQLLLQTLQAGETPDLAECGESAGADPGSGRGRRRLSKGEMI